MGKREKMAQQGQQQGQNPKPGQGGQQQQGTPKPGQGGQQGSQQQQGGGFQNPQR